MTDSTRHWKCTRNVMFIVIVVLATLPGCVLPEAVPTTMPYGPIPSGWIHDYDYEAPLSPYLRNQYQLAVQNGERAYVYLYTDHNHCTQTRRLIDTSPVVADAFDGVRIIMLNETRMDWHVPREHRTSRDGYLWLPALLAVTPDGRLDERKGVFPDIYLFHTSMLREPYNPSNRGSRLVNSEIAKLIRREFGKHTQAAPAN